MSKNLKIISLFLVIPMLSYSQENEKIDWLSFNQLEDSLAVKPKKTFLFFYAEWCAYCKKMERNALKDPEVIEELSKNYYAVKMDAESTDTIAFGGRQFNNEQSRTQRNGIHEIALLLASRKNRPFSLPATLIMNENFEVIARVFEYMPGSKMKRLIKQMD